MIDSRLRFRVTGAEPLVDADASAGPCEADAEAAAAAAPLVDVGALDWRPLERRLLGPSIQTAAMQAREDEGSTKPDELLVKRVAAAL